MGKKLNRKNKQIYVISSDDDDDDVEGNEDLSLKIVEKSLKLNAVKSSDDIEHVISSDDDDVEGKEDLSLKTVEKAALIRAAANDVAAVKTPNMMMKANNTNRTTDDDSPLVVVGAKDEENADISKAMESEETDPIENPDSLVLRKLLRGPRYFDPPNSGSSWGACFNCGEEGHTVANCSVAKRRRPCFICGSLEHHAKQCSKAQDCYICKKGGHRAKDCPEKNKGSSKLWKICLKCGDSGHHDFFSCKNDYSADDLKGIQCYICKGFGHLCCADFIDTCPRELSCYRCGQLGHGGLDCGKSAKAILRPRGTCHVCKEVGHSAKNCPSSAKDYGKSRTPKAHVGSPGKCYECDGIGHLARDCPGSTKDHGESHNEACFRCGEVGHFARECFRSIEDHGETHSEACFRCGEVGHFARECFRSNEIGNRKSEFSTPTQKFPRERVTFKKAKSMTSEVFKPQKRKETDFKEGRSPASYSSKKRGGWITDDPIYSLSGEPHMRHYISSPETPTYRYGHGFRSVDTPYGSTSYRYGPSDDSLSQYRYAPSDEIYRQYGRAPLNIGSSPYGPAHSHEVARPNPYYSSESPNLIQPRYPTSRFYNSNSDGVHRTDHWNR